jgi:hypothetical protein
MKTLADTIVEDRKPLWDNLVANKHSACAFVATVSPHVGEPFDIHCDGFQHLRHGIMFARTDGSSRYIAASLVAEIEVVPAAPIAGTA